MTDNATIIEMYNEMKEKGVVEHSLPLLPSPVDKLDAITKSEDYCKNQLLLSRSKLSFLPVKIDIGELLSVDYSGDAFSEKKIGLTRIYKDQETYIVLSETDDSDVSINADFSRWKHNSVINGYSASLYIIRRDNVYQAISFWRINNVAYRLVIFFDIHDKLTSKETTKEYSEKLVGTILKPTS